VIRSAGALAIVLCSVSVAPAQAQRMHPSPFARLGAPPPPTQWRLPLARAPFLAGTRTGVAYPPRRALAVDPSAIRPTHWLLGGIIGAVVVGWIGAEAALGIGECRCAKDAVLGFGLGAPIGFTVGALIGGQFPKFGP
jgi:hypothetical protein